MSDDLATLVRFLERYAQENDQAVIYDGAETLSATKEQAKAWQFFGLVEYSPEDGPNGIMYRPTEGRKIADIKDALAVRP